MAADDYATFRLSPVQLAHFFQALQGPPDWRAQVGIQLAAGVHFGGHYLVLRGDLDESRLAGSWRQLVRSEPMLRTGFVTSEVARPVQRVYRSVNAEIELVDWSHPGADPAAELAALRATESSRGFDLQTPPLARLIVARITPGLHWMIMVAHRVILDEWSAGLLFLRLLHRYDSQHEPGPAGSYPAHAELLRGRGIGAAERFWTDVMRGYYQPVQLGGDMAAAHLADDLAMRTTLALPAGDELSALIAERGRISGIAPETFVYAAFALALSRYSGEADVIIGAELPGRAHHPGLAGLAGPFRNTVPLRVVIDENGTAADLLAAVERSRRAITEYEYVPEPLIREWSERQLARAWLFAHVVSQDSGGPAVHQPSGLTVTAERLTPQLPPLPLGLSWRWQDERLHRSEERR